ncbi:cytochrome P460 family protein [Pseudomonas sp. MBLB4123]|uniref:cytochrome P460 family protein n=1 Tax=Pseudomonas sp. MBLB4123 TaxID=3451557 RepID=UPI003F756133
MKPLVALTIALTSLSAQGADLAEQTFSTYVDAKGDIRLPADARSTWIHLGSWVVADQQAPGYGFHDVYTQPETVAAYRKTGAFPDGAVLIKEIRAVEQGPQTTGQAQWAGDANVWFVMVKDRQSRFPDNPHWAEGWGWGLYEAKNPAVNVSKGFAETCRGCHVPAQQSDWVFSQGYPTLAKP